jgi:hypothetical protein
MINRYPPVITGYRTSSQLLFSPFPIGLQFETHTCGSHLLKPMIGPAFYCMTMNVSTKELQTLVTGCVKQLFFQTVQFSQGFARQF